MPSLLKTAFLQLNKWAGNEYLKREDFVSDNEKIDAAIQTHNTQLAHIELDKANKQQENWQNATLVNGWVNYGGGYDNAGFYKDDLGIVRLRGMIKSGTVTAGTKLFALPLNYRPTSIKEIPTLSYTFDVLKPIALEILTNGDVILGALASNGWLTLENITFRV